MRLRIKGHVDAPISSVPKIVRGRILKSVSGTVPAYSRVLVPYLNNRASEAFLEFLESAGFPQYVALVAEREVPGRPTVVLEDPLRLLRHRTKYPIYRPLDASEIAYARLRYSRESPVFSGIFPFRRVHPRELGAYLLARRKRFPRKHRPGKERELVLSLEARYPRLVVSAAAFVESVSNALRKHISLEALEIEPEERRFVG